MFFHLLSYEGWGGGDLDGQEFRGGGRLLVLVDISYVKTQDKM